MNIKKPAYVALKTLGTDIVLQIDEKLIAGETGRMVADWLQKAGLLKDVKREALIRMIERYRGTEVREKLVKRIADAADGQEPDHGRPARHRARRAGGDRPHPAQARRQDAGARRRQADADHGDVQ